MNEKNVEAINKIISDLAMKDYLITNPRKSDGSRKYKHHYSYTLSEETKEAKEILHQYLYDEITEEEYKVYCLRYNLTHK